jgi:hypothetical protein
MRHCHPKPSAVTVRSFTLAEPNDWSLTPPELIKALIRATVLIDMKFQYITLKKIAWETRLNIFLLSEAPRTVMTWAQGRTNLKLIFNMYKHKQTASIPAILQEILRYTSSTVQLKCDGTRWRTGGEVKGDWRMEWVASTLHTTSEHGVSSITTADVHTSAAGSRLNWRPRWFKWTRPFRRKTKYRSL